MKGGALTINSVYGDINAEEAFKMAQQRNQMGPQFGNMQQQANPSGTQAQQVKKGGKWNLFGKGRR